MEVYEALPGGDAKGAVIVIQEAFGVNEHIMDVTRRMAAEGYHAVAPALFHRAGGGTAPYDDFSKVMPLFEGMSDAGTTLDIDAVLEHLHGTSSVPSSASTVAGSSPREGPSYRHSSGRPQHSRHPGSDSSEIKTRVFPSRT